MEQPIMLQELRKQCPTLSEARHLSESAVMELVEQAKNKVHGQFVLPLQQAPSAHVAEGIVRQEAINVDEDRIVKLDAKGAWSKPKTCFNTGSLILAGAVETKLIGSLSVLLGADDRLEEAFIGLAIVSICGLGFKCGVKESWKSAGKTIAIGLAVIVVISMSIFRPMMMQAQEQFVVASSEGSILKTFIEMTGGSIVLTIVTAALAALTAVILGLFTEKTLVSIERHFITWRVRRLKQAQLKTVKRILTLESQASALEVELSAATAILKTELLAAAREETVEHDPEQVARTVFTVGLTGLAASATYMFSSSHTSLALLLSIFIGLTTYGGLSWSWLRRAKNRLHRVAALIFLGVYCGSLSAQAADLKNIAVVIDFSESIQENRREMKRCALEVLRHLQDGQSMVVVPVGTSAHDLPTLRLVAPNAANIYVAKRPMLKNIAALGGFFEKMSQTPQGSDYAGAMHIAGDVSSGSPKLLVVCGDFKHYVPSKAKSKKFRLIEHSLQKTKVFMAGTVHSSAYSSVDWPTVKLIQNQFRDELLRVGATDIQLVRFAPQAKLSEWLRQHLGKPNPFFTKLFPQEEE